MSVQRSLTALLVPLAFGLAACGGSGSQPSGGQPETTGAAAEAAPQGANAILIDTFQFMPKSLAVKAGTTVTWTSTDTVGHTVTSGAPNTLTGVFDEMISPNGGTVTVTFDQAGTFVYFCNIHKSMRGEMVVQ